MNKTQITAIVNNQDAGSFSSAEELEAVAATFSLAAEAVRRGEHGNVTWKTKVGDYLAEVSIHQIDGAFDEKTGLPQLIDVTAADARGRHE